MARCYLPVVTIKKNVAIPNIMQWLSLYCINFQDIIYKYYHGPYATLITFYIDIYVYTYFLKKECFNLC